MEIHLTDRLDAAVHGYSGLNPPKMTVPVTLIECITAASCMVDPSLFGVVQLRSFVAVAVKITMWQVSGGCNGH